MGAMSESSLKERIALAQELDCKVIVRDGGNGKIAAIYTRVSGPKQAMESIYSLKRQRGMADQAAEMNYSGIIVILADIVGVFGALGPEARPGFQTLCQLIELGIANDVFVMDFTRLVREKVIGLDFAAICIQNQVTIVDETGRVLDPGDDVGLILYVLELTKSEDERRRINSRLQISRRLKASEGKDPGGSIPTGYFTDPDLKKNDPGYTRFEVYEPHKPFISFVFTKMLEVGSSPRQILRACRANGFTHLPPFEPEKLRRHMEQRTALRRSPRDEMGNYVVTTTLVTSIVRNYEWYTGVFEWATNSSWGPPIRIEDNHPPIIDPKLRGEIQRILGKGRRGSYSPNGMLPLSGLVWTLNSQGDFVPLAYSMVTGYAPRYIHSWEYNRSLPSSRTWSLVHSLVDEPVCKAVLDRLVLPDYADRVAAELETHRREALDVAARYQASRERLKKEIENLQSNFARVSHPDDIASIERQLAKRREQLTQLAAEAESQIVGRQIMSEHDIETYRQFLADLPSLWESADNVLRNRFLSIVLEGVYIVHHSIFFDAKIVWYNGEEDVVRVHIPPRFRRRKEWTEEEEQYLRENYATATWSELATCLGRKESAIELRAFYVGLKRQCPTEPKKRWTAEEKKVLQRYSQSEISYEKMRESLPDRWGQTIYSKMKRLGLPQPTSPHWYYLSQSYGLEFPSSLTGHKSGTVRPARRASPGA